jgi:hypothetical protein
MKKREMEVAPNTSVTYEISMYYFSLFNWYSGSIMQIAVWILTYGVSQLIV